MAKGKGKSVTALNVTSLTKRFTYIQDILEHMLNHASYADNFKNAKIQGSMMLAGDPGVGKSSFVKSLVRILGLDLVTIEAPHITEEQIINIPFVVFDPIKNKTGEGTMQFDPTKNRIVMAESNLLTRLKSIRLYDEKEVLASIYSGSKVDKLTREIFEKLGGGPDKLPPIVASIREQHKIVMFLDEFFRQTNPRIQNVLRSILNGEIGMDKLPKHVYVIYATNLKDKGDSITEIPSNTHFTEIVEMEAPTRDEWFAWMHSEYDGVKEVGLNPDVLQAFYDLFQDDEDEKGKAKGDPAKPSKWETLFNQANETRVSPRRLEQLILMVNASLQEPLGEKSGVKEGEWIRTPEQQMCDLLASVKANFTNYMDGAEHSMLPQVLELVCSLIERATGIRVDPSMATGTEDWRSTISHQISVKKKLGNHRHYIPVMAGPPGIGKTAIVSEIAQHNKLLYVYIDCSQLEPESVIGLPISRSAKGDFTDASVDFSEPPLFKLIQKKTAQEWRDLKARWASTLSPAAALKKQLEFGKQKYKTLIFFDELSRVKTEAVFNSLRRVLLEKKFNDHLSLGDDVICISALNPTDGRAGAAMELTMHVRDVLDIVGATPSWAQTRQYIMDRVEPEMQADKRVKAWSMQAIEAVIATYQTPDVKVPNQQRPFHLEVSTGSDIYVSPRLYTDLYKASVTKMNARMQAYDPAKEKNPQQVNAELLNRLQRTWQNALRLPLHLGGAASSEFMNRVFITLDSIKIDVQEIGIAEEIKDIENILKSLLRKWEKDDEYDVAQFQPLLTYYDTGIDAIRTNLYAALNALDVKKLESIDAGYWKLEKGSFTKGSGDGTLFGKLIKGLLHAAVTNEVNNILPAVEEAVYFAADDYYGPIFNELNQAPELDEAALAPILVMDKVLSEISDIVHP